MSYLAQAKELTSKQRCVSTEKLIETMRFNSYALVNAKCDLNSFQSFHPRLEDYDWHKKQIDDLTKKVEELKESLILLQKAFLENI